jgi:hypothetical protein
MKRNIIIAIVAAGIVVLFFVMILDEANQEIFSNDSDERTGNIDL